MGDCRPWGGAREELLVANLFGTAGRRPNRGCRPRAEAEAAWHNVTKPHRPRTCRDAGLLDSNWDRRPGAGARVKLEQAPQGATGVDSEETRASGGPEEEYDLGLCRPSDGMTRRPVDPSRPVVRPDC
jgi:hypothetical protein